MRGVPARAPFDVSAIPASPGVYLLYSGQECVYVGYSVKLRRRIKHHPLRGKFDRAEVLPMSMEEMAAAECRLIELHRPRYNKRIGYTSPRGAYSPPRFDAWYWDKDIRHWTATFTTDLDALRARGYCIARRKAS